MFNRDIDRVLKAKVQLQKKKPFYGRILLGIWHEENPNIDTARINMHGRLQYNPDWIADMTDGEIEGVIMHEGLHMILEHLLRRIGWQEKLDRFELHAWAIAVDLVVNDILVSENQELPKGEVEGQYPIPNSNHSFFIPQIGLKIENIHEKNAELIYREIIDKMKELGYGKNNSGGNGGKDKKESDENQQGDGGSGGKQEEDENGNGNGDNDNENDNQNDNDLDNLIKGFDEHEIDDKATQEEKEKERKKWRKTFSKAIQMSRGDLPLGVERRFQELYKETINWQGILYRYITNSIFYDYTYRRPSPSSYAISSYMGRSIVLPSDMKENIDLIVAIDTSASITRKTLDTFVSEMIGIANQFSNVNMTIIVADSDIKGKPIEIQNANPDKIKKQIELKGGGGTSHLPVFRWVEENKPDCKILICLTDGMTRYPDHTNIETLWVIGGRNRIGVDNIPFGRVIEIASYEDEKFRS